MKSIVCSRTSFSAGIRKVLRGLTSRSQSSVERSRHCIDMFLSSDASLIFHFASSRLSPGFTFNSMMGAGVWVAVGVFVAVAVGVGVAVLVAVGVCVAVGVAVRVGVDVGVSVGFSPPGRAATTLEII